ncbi:MAG TPA: glycosyltransferase family 4 protein [Chitinophagaceae bacterium]|nr:glycosyltransferase family 4 protein [Chitinophagaceae bacterium]
MNPSLHIVCLDAPAPPDYGGAIDMYYSIEALLNAGVAVHLHYFRYREGRDAGPLAARCASVQAYRRATGLRGVHPNRPYTVHSRTSRALVENLNRDHLPVLLHGLHCTGILSRLQPAGRPIFLRMHNNEAAYYQMLAGQETTARKKIFFQREARLLHHWQQSLANDLPVWSLSPADTEQLTVQYGWTRIQFLPCFIPWQNVEGKAGWGNFCLYHGNLSVPENEKAARWLITEIFKDAGIPLVVAGYRPSQALRELVAKHPLVQLVENPDPTAMDQLVAEAHLHVLPSFSNTGVKLKLLHALFRGRHCLTFGAEAAGTGQAQGFGTAQEAGAFRDAVHQYMNRPFTEGDRAARKYLEVLYDRKKNAALIKNWIS